MKRTQFKIKLRDQVGDEHERVIFAHDEATARERAIVRVRTALGKSMADRRYGQFEVLSCDPVVSKS